MLWAMLMITSAINQAAQIPMMMSQTMSQVAGIMRWASELAARFHLNSTQSGGRLLARRHQRPSTEDRG